jgi:chromosome partitioning protein
MAHILCIANQKGGVGKTTSAINLAAALAFAHQHTLLIDCDPQGNATSGVGIDKTELPETLYHGLIGTVPPHQLITPTEIEHLQIIPSRLELIGFEIEMIKSANRETALRNLVAGIKSDYDYIIIDCPPSLNLLTLNAMTAAHSILIPLQCEFYALEGLGQLLQTIKKIKATLNPSLRIAGILLTMYDRRTNLSRQVAEDATKHFRNLVFNTIIPRNVRLGEAPSFGKPILLYDAASVGARSYLALAKEILNESSHHQISKSA